MMMHYMDGPSTAASFIRQTRMLSLPSIARVCIRDSHHEVIQATTSRAYRVHCYELVGYRVLD